MSRFARSCKIYKSCEKSQGRQRAYGFYKICENCEKSLGQLFFKAGLRILQNFRKLRKIARSTAGLRILQNLRKIARSTAGLQILQNLQKNRKVDDSSKRACGFYKICESCEKSQGRRFFKRACENYGFYNICENCEKLQVPRFSVFSFHFITFLCLVNDIHLKPACGF